MMEGCVLLQRRWMGRVVSFVDFSGVYIEADALITRCLSAGLLGCSRVMASFQ